VPTAALRFRPPTADGEAVAAPVGAAVWRLVDGRPEAVAVTSGLTDDSYTEVQPGAVREGDAVIVAVARPPGESAAASTQRPPGFNMGGGGRRR
jgi:HlyD family secretion protein